ncbi:tyrosine-protein phosphatase non-receptor type 13 isoform X2 [Alosa sapidissima]|uniref:tyrosine-protein phosphatase non-receptor type 13 isoform X2 n=1 Tax=Alosa sapidissima TaxID=34773 RepID=UPI001C097A43|nr:tyrosine-protein phosphatase non-receptor type 13 isoform X2 [Alosa sapidissima]
MGTFVTLAEVLEERGAPLEEREVWSVLITATQALRDLFSKGSGGVCSVITPGSLLLSSAGGVAFKSCARFEGVASFTAPEATQGRSPSSRAAPEKMSVFSLGMTLYWTVDYQLPSNQPVLLSERLNNLLLSMCEECVSLRSDLQDVLEVCEQHHQHTPQPVHERVIRQLVEDVQQDPENPVATGSNQLTDRSQTVRDRLRGLTQQSTSWTNRGRNSLCQPLKTEQLRSRMQSVSHRDSTVSWLNRSPLLDGVRTPRPTDSFGSSFSLAERKLKNSGPEFVRMLEEPLIILELPESIVSKKGKSGATQRDLRVFMPSGQCIMVKCDVKSKGGDVFDMIVAHTNLVEHFYFGLAYCHEEEFFFLDSETKLCKVAPESWKRVPTSSFALHFRIKFYVSDITLLLHKLTRHQYYLQLRRDLLEERLGCDVETELFLSALALQAEYGDCLPEVYGKSYYRPEHYVCKSVLAKMAAPCLKEELVRLHGNRANMTTEDAELEFLMTVQQLADYGLFFHRVAREKKGIMGEQMLGVCTKGVIVYDVKNTLRTVSMRFHWRETLSISSSKRKFLIESSTSKKKHTFHTERSHIAKYLCELCSAQHKFHKEMNSRQLSHSVTSEENIVQYATVFRAQNSAMARHLSTSDSGHLNHAHLSHNSMSSPGMPRPDSVTGSDMNRLCEDIASRLQAKIRLQRDSLSATSSPVMRRVMATTPEMPHRRSETPVTSPVFRADTPTNRIRDRETVCVTLRKDPQLGLGIVIVGEDNTGRLDLGIFIASVVPGGPADRDGRIKPGGRLISLNQISLEGVTFTEAAEIMQNSSSEVEIIVSQPKGVRPLCVGRILPRNYDSQSTLLADSRQTDEELDELVSVMMTPKASSNLHVPEVRIRNAQDNPSLSGSCNSLKPEEFTVELRKESGSLGISIAAAVNSNNQQKGIYIKNLMPGGVAELDGRIQSGDRLLEVDGIRLDTLTNQQAAERLSKAGEIVSLVLERESLLLPRRYVGPGRRSTLAAPSNASMRNNSCPAITMTTPFSIHPKDYSFVSDENIMEVSLRKRLNGLGFSFLIAELDTSLDSGTVVLVKRLFPGQPAEESGLIREGDVILAVNGEPLKGLSYQRVLELLRGSPSEVRLVLCRPEAGVLPPVSDKIGQLTCS